MKKAKKPKRKGKKMKYKINIMLKHMMERITKKEIQKIKHIKGREGPRTL